MSNSSLAVQTEFHLINELHKTVIQSLITSFYLYFILLDDKKGGDVDTVHNARAYANGDSEINISANIKQKIADNKKYDSHEYHSHKHYKDKGAADKKLHRKGKLVDEYSNKKMSRDKNRQLDHIISASEIHNDGGAILAGIDGVDLENQDSNFQSIGAYINNLKSNHKIDSSWQRYYRRQ